MNDILSISYVVSLAVVDAINPCALAVLTMMLIAIITYNPKNKKNIILAGLAFSSSVFIMYMLYGFGIIFLFKQIQAIKSIQTVLYKVLGTAALLLGSLQIKDYIKYKVGSFGTEMPMALRPKLKKVISKITSPLGAFIIGLFVTVFLLPCTIGPYVILGGALSVFDFFSVIPLLLLYNFIFVLPMLIITFLVYFGIKKAGEVSKWKDENIRVIHLISGIIILTLGLLMIAGAF